VKIAEGTPGQLCRSKKKRQETGQYTAPFLPVFVPVGEKTDFLNRKVFVKNWKRSLRNRLLEVT
jgi:hypothetical protein